MSINILLENLGIHLRWYNSKQYCVVIA